MSLFGVVLFMCLLIRRCCVFCLWEILLCIIVGLI